MAKIFITGSSDGLGQLAASRLVKEGHEVTLHARNQQRAHDAKSKIPGAKHVVIADLSNLDETKRMADELNKLGRFDAIIHNAGVYAADAALYKTVNTLSPYLLTCLVTKPERLIYLSSGEHLRGTANLTGLASGRISYGDSKIHVMLLANAVARKFPNIYSNSINPGWVPTKMGGRNAPDDLDEGYETQVWLAVSQDPEALVSGKYFFHRKEYRHSQKVDDAQLQEEFLETCYRLTKVKLVI